MKANLTPDSGMTFEQIGAELGVSPAMAFKIYRIGCLKLRRRYGRDFEGFLRVLSRERNTTLPRTARKACSA